MNQDAIDRAMREDREISPSPGFAPRVMRSVRREAARRQAMPFPWHVVAGGLAIAAALIIASSFTGGMRVDAEAAARLQSLAPALGWLFAALAGSLGMAWGSVRFAGYF